MTVDGSFARVRRRGRGSARRFLSNPTGVVGAAILLVIFLAAALAPWIAAYDPNLAVPQDALAPASPAHPLGTDRAGRDLFSRLIWGAQTTLLATLLALVVALVIGVPSGLIAGFYGKWFDSASSWVNNLLMALPGVVILLAVRAVAGPSVWISMTVMGVLLAPSFYRLVRTSVVDVRRELFIDAARVMGVSEWRIVFRHILGVVRGPIIIQSALVAAVAITVQSGLEFLGIGDPRIPTWGSLLNDAFRNIYNSPAMVIWPGLALALTCTSLALVANAVRDALEDRDGSSRASRRRSSAKTVSDRAAADPPRVGGDPAPEALLAVEGLEVSYGRADGSETKVVHDVSFSLGRGEILGIVGESGSGKSQTAFSILGLLAEGGHVSGGTIWLDGVDLATLSSRRRAQLRGTTIGYIPQDPMSNLDPSFRIGSQLDEPLRLRLKLGRQEARERSLELLARVGIADPERVYASYPHEISGGMAQRVLIAGAVSCRPKLLVADEPTTALDVTVQAEVLDLLRQLQAEMQMSVLLVTHNLGVVSDLCDRVAVMKDGRIVETGGVAELFDSPRHSYTRKLYESSLDGTVARPPLTGETTAVIS